MSHLVIVGGSDAGIDTWTSVTCICSQEQLQAFFYA